MKVHLSIAAAALVAAAGLVLAAQDKPASPQGPKPGPEHEVLKALEGTWDAVHRMATEPGKPPLESKGTETNTLICGGLWLVTNHKAEMMRMPFEGHGVLGYDTERKVYVGNWVDNMWTGQMVLEGTYDAATKTITTVSEAPGPAGKRVRWVMKHAIQDNDHNSLTMLTPGPDGKDAQVMEIIYTRRK